MDATNTTNASARLDDFAGWSALPANWCQVESNSYSGSGFDRGFRQCCLFFGGKAASLYAPINGPMSPEKASSELIANTQGSVKPGVFA
ncbi:hypothetical protein [Mucilaginibacter sp.]|uniref:hypothetical protein n=1 Tax=Mucilaginibacter sp. TaxID=1882438 RepID=UPI0025F5FAD9|nr:hypothetical protein [Mucilaginibacter sp.]